MTTIVSVFVDKFLNSLSKNRYGCSKFADLEDEANTAILKEYQARFLKVLKITGKSWYVTTIMF